MDFSLQIIPFKRWIPLAFIVHGTSDQNADIPVGTHINSSVVVIRGYETRVMQVSNFSLRICDFMLSGAVQFRWLQTSRFKNSITEPGVKDAWSLDDIEISYQDESGQRSVLLEDSFDDGTLRLGYGD